MHTLPNGKAQCRGGIESEWTVGSPVSFFDGDSDTLTDSGVVLECDPPRRLVYSFTVEFDEEARKQGYKTMLESGKPLPQLRSLEEKGRPRSEVQR